MARTLLRCRILGQKFRIVETGELARGLHGECEGPKRGGFRRILLREGLRERDLLETVIHEATHGAFWWLDEDYVTLFGRDLARLLRRMGWRKA